MWSTVTSVWFKGTTLRHAFEETLVEVDATSEGRMRRSVNLARDNFERGGAADRVPRTIRLEASRYPHELLFARPSYV